MRGAVGFRGADLESYGMWRGTDQAPSLQFTREEWLRFIAAVVEFARATGVAEPSLTAP